MEEKELRTSPKQRIFIILIAVFMVGSIIASYAAIVVSGSQSQATTEEASEIDEAKVAEYTKAYEEIQAEFINATKEDYDRFTRYRGNHITAYNETSANENGVQTEDLREGSGAEVTNDNYLAYYVGWCADETIFDSSYDNNDNPTGFAKILDPSLGMIEGWSIGVEGMKQEGAIRIVTIPGELAYGDQMEICGGKNKPLKFMIMTKEKTDSLNTLSQKLDDAYMRLEYANYGIDYDTVKANQE